MTQEKQGQWPLCNIPTIEEETRPYWEGCARHELLIQRCTQCNSYQFYPRAFCGECYGLALEWVKSTGHGTIWTYTVTHRNRDPGFNHMVPYVMAYVELEEEDVKMLTNIVECDPESVYIGMPVEVTFKDVSEKITLPLFKPRE